MSNRVAEAVNGAPPREFDNTMLTSADECMRRLLLFWSGLEAVEEPAYFAFGRIWQDTLAVWYTTSGDTATRLAAGLSFIDQAWADSGARADGVNNPDNLRYLLLFYAIEYGKEPWEVLALKGRMELGFSFPLSGTPWSLTGALDGYINWPPYGLLLLENKTAGLYLNDQYMSQWGFSPQVTQYLWGLTQLLGEAPFGALMNCASKRISDKAKAEFKKSGAVPENIFMRNLEKRSAFKLKEFETHTRLLIEDIVREWERKVWPKTKNHQLCVGGIGKSPCPFRRLCLADSEPWEMDEASLLMSDLKWRDGPWEPWKRGGGAD